MAPLLEVEVSYRVPHHCVYIVKGEKLTRARTWTRRRVARAVLGRLVALARDGEAVCASRHGREGVCKPNRESTGRARRSSVGSRFLVYAYVADIPAAGETRKGGLSAAIGW